MSFVAMGNGMGNAQSLHALLDQTGWIHALARQLVSDPHLAADLAQDTCVEALESGPDSGRPLRGWLATVMRNQLAKLRRGDGNRAAREGERGAAAHSPETLDLVERAETHRNVVLGVLALEEPYRSTLLMRFFEQLPYDEIARKTGLSKAAVNSRITRGLERLRQRLETTYGGDRRALAVALLPVAKLPTGVATTLLGAKVMYATIATAAATLVAVSVSVAVSGGGRETEPAPVVSGQPEPTRTRGEPVLEMPSLASRVELAPEAQREQKEHDHKKHDTDDSKTWKAELFHTLALAPSVESLGVNASSGDVEVAESRTGQVEIDARVSARLGVVKDAELTRLFEDHVDVYEEDGRLVIEDKHKNSRGWDVDLVVRVPGKLAVSANSGSGDVIVRRASGTVSANTGSGDVRVELASERFEVCDANTGSGDVVVEVLSVEKKLGANSGSGDVIVRVAEGSSPGRVSMNSGSGDVRLIVPANVVGSFDLESMDSIEIPSSLGIRVVEERGGRNQAKGTVGAGGGNYSLRSGSGELAIELGSALPSKNQKR